jgi:hypothetical protein
MLLTGQTLAITFAKAIGQKLVAKPVHVDC